MKRKNQFYDRILQNFYKVSNDEKKRIFERLYDLYYSLNLIIENLEEGIIAINNEGIIQGINKKASFLFSIPRDSEGKQISECLKEISFGHVILDLIKSTITTETKLLHDEDRGMILQINILPLGESGKIIGTLIKAFDITKTYERDQKLKRAEQLASLTTLAAGVAHEIKNPLGSISIYIQLIEKTISKTMDKSSSNYRELKDYCDIVKEEIGRLEDIVNSFLFSVRKIDLEVKEINLRNLILSTISFLKYEIEEKNIEIEVNFEHDDIILRLDEKYIKQALINIIQNAIDSMDRTDKKRIFISLKTNHKDAIVSVKDTGSGIKEDMLVKIFEPYFTTKRHGTGLGLTNVVRIIEAHSGSVSIDSEFGVGTEVIIKLPILQGNQKFLLSDELDYA